MIFLLLYNVNILFSISRNIASSIDTQMKRIPMNVFQQAVLNGGFSSPLFFAQRLTVKCLYQQLNNRA